MVKKWWLLAIPVILLSVGIIYRETNRKESSTVGPLTFRTYQNQKGGYEISVPETWTTEEATNGGMFVTRTVFKRQFSKERAGNIGEIDISVVASPSSTQLFSRYSEFMTWKYKPDQPATGTGVIKLKNEMVGGEDAIRLAEVDMVPENISQSWWSITTWFIRNKVNYYINMMGNGALGETEFGIFDRMLASFRWL